MTATAQGSQLRCDKHGCNAVATVDQDAWSFCASHAGVRVPSSLGHVGGVPTPIAHPNATGTTITLPATPPAPLNPIGLLLEQRGKPAAPRRATDEVAGEFECRNGCGRSFGRTQGRGKHELSCTGGAA